MVSAKLFILVSRVYMIYVVIIVLSRQVVNVSRQLNKFNVISDLDNNCY